MRTGDSFASCCFSLYPCTLPCPCRALLTVRTLTMANDRCRVIPRTRCSPRELVPYRNRDLETWRPFVVDAHPPFLFLFLLLFLLLILLSVPLVVIVDHCLVPACSYSTSMCRKGDGCDYSCGCGKYFMHGMSRFGIIDTTIVSH